ncbi:hypothetical protein B0H16DRAFT_1480365 [Mycena metata]|uniref:Uncharacterized protein n=1 Tax=Mycena metata TaxID=1033252 RepID=A0AAD7H3Y4_9AGAR|nr:hypothetical protein B0H16DRAFT_1480365 [Mycena metata]
MTPQTFVPRSQRWSTTQADLPNVQGLQNVEVDEDLEEKCVRREMNRNPSVNLPDFSAQNHVQNSSWKTLHRLSTPWKSPNDTEIELFGAIKHTNINHFVAFRARVELLDPGFLCWDALATEFSKEIKLQFTPGTGDLEYEEIYTTYRCFKWNKTENPI